MTPRQKLLVQSTFEKVMLEADLVGELFYRRLFVLDPSLRHLFLGDLAPQARRFMQVLAMTVKQLNSQLEGLHLLHELGKRHSSYTAMDQHYRIVGQALLWALEAGIGGQFTPEVREAWTIFYQELSQAMLQETEPSAPRSVSS